MLRKLFIGLFLAATAALQVLAQGNGTLQGKVTDASTNEGVPFATVVVKMGGVQKGGVFTDESGKYKFSALAPGTYDLEVTVVGYSKTIKQGISVNSDKITFVNLSLKKGLDMGGVDISTYKEQLVDPGKTSSGGTISRQDIEKMAVRDVVSLAANVAGAVQADDNRGINLRGGREEQTTYFVDGIRVRGSLALPNSAIQSATVVTGGVSAQYGDATSGVISVTTRAGTKDFSMGGEVLTSQFLDPYGYNLVALNFSGPLAVKKEGVDELGKPKVRPILSYFLAAEAEKTKDNSPSALGVWQLNEDVLKKIQENPLRPSPTGTGYIQNALFVTQKDLVNVAARPNADYQRLSLNGKLDFTPNDKITLTLGGTFNNDQGKDYGRINALFNYPNVSNFNNSTYRVYGRFKQTFGGNTGPKEGEAAQKSTSNVKLSYYQVQVDYTKTTGLSQADGLGLNPFNYGYHGKFAENMGAFYVAPNPNDTTLLLRPSDSSVVLGPNGDTVRIGNLSAYHVGFNIDGFNWTPGTVDSRLAAYNQSIFNSLGSSFFGTNQQIFQIAGGFANGQMPGSVYSIWTAPGIQPNGFGKSETNLFRLTGQGSVDIGKHSLIFGLEYDQRTDRSWNVSPLSNSLGIWGLARSLTNRHISELDLNNPILGLNQFTGNVDTVTFNRLYSAENQSTFDSRLRQALNKDTLEWIGIDALDPSLLKLDYFSANELLNNGQSYIGYFGYDYLGNTKNSSNDQLAFFTDSVNRPISPYTPIYTAGYLEDQFTFDDLVFKVGLRVDRFDANQPVLKDPYLLYPAKTAGEVDGTLNPTGAHPGTIGNDYVVYVNSETNPTTILGYRSGNRWFGANGQELSTANGLAQNSVTGRITPYLNTPGILTASDGERGKEMKEAFDNYKPQVNLMPRVAFTFPISDEAMFFAHYDILTKRPSNNFRFDPTDYFYLANVGGTINNPDLKPERTIDYQLGFKQKLGTSSALTIQAYYREMRNMVQIIPINFAYPVNYFTYGNIDFGNVKGLTVDYDLRRSGNVRMTASYTLQFAEGTGSNANSASTFVNLGLDAIRTPFALSFDARHRIVTNLDYRFGTGKNYTGPKSTALRAIFEGFGFNFTANYISGTPYTRQRLVTPAAAPAIGGRTQQKGDINSSRLPGQFRVNFRCDKDINIKVGTTENGKPKYLSTTIYLQVLNLLDARNILGSYAYTGSPSDDGYLASPLGAQQLQSVFSQQSFIDLYRASMDNPGFYSLPRRTRLGIRFNL